MSLAIEIEDQHSWPSSFLAELRRARALIVSFHHEEYRLDQLAEDDEILRIHRPANRYQNDYLELVDRLDGELADHRIVGYHCTRLTPQEIIRVKRDGLRILSRELVHQRLDKAAADRLLGPRDHASLQGNASIEANLDNKHGTRTGMVWFCPNRSSLREHTGVFRFFRAWGGEAMYAHNEKDSDIFPILRALGSPCIVKCGLPFVTAEPKHPRFAERFVSQFVSDEIYYPEPSASFDLRTTVDVAPDSVLDVIEFSDSRFDAVTDCSNWPDQFQIA